MNTRQMLERRAQLVKELRDMQDAADTSSDGTLTPDQQKAFDAVKAALADLEAAMLRRATIEEFERRASGAPIASADRGFDRQLHEFSVVRAIAATGRRLEGHAAVFDSPAPIGSFVETVKPGAFRSSLAATGKDVLALVDHDPGRLLARTSSGTLRLSEDSKGLAFSLDVPDTQLGHDVLALAHRGDLGGCSFGFRVNDEAWPAADRREPRAVDLIEISIVHAWPAYAQTSVQARARAGQIDAVRQRRRYLETL